ncbi:MAG: NAD(P)/FAD-dependent oxidoreductase [Pseudomonadota bacterium]
MVEERKVAIIGGGPAGLSAALTLARGNVNAVLFDAPAPPRNAASGAVGNLPGNDGIAPHALRERIRAELRGYNRTEVRTADVRAIAGDPEDGFTVTPSTGDAVTVARVILACGRRDIYPDVEGFSDYWAKSIHNCPYCGGYDDRGTAWGIVLNRPEMIDIIEIYRMWSDDLTLFLEPGIAPDPARIADLSAKGIAVETSPIRRVVGDGQRMRAVDLEDGRSVARHALIWWPMMTVPDLVTDLGLTLSHGGDVAVDEGFRTSRSGIYAAGDLIYSEHQTTATAIHQGGACAAAVVFDIAMAV